jgi:hypothetical protein
MYKYPPHFFFNDIPHLTLHHKMSSTCSSSPISTVKFEQHQLARRRAGSPEQNWMARAAQHTAMIVQAVTHWAMPISTIIQDFRHCSPS